MEIRTLLVQIFGVNGTITQGHVNISVTQLEQDVVATKKITQGSQVYDAHGAALYILAVVLVYGLSIVLLIGSLIKRHKRSSQLDNWDYEDRQVARYMQQMRDLKEESARENYRQLKRSIMRSVRWKSPSNILPTTVGDDQQQKLAGNSASNVLSVVNDDDHKLLLNHSSPQFSVEHEASTHCCSVALDSGVTLSQAVIAALTSDGGQSDGSSISIAVIEAPDTIPLRDKLRPPSTWKLHVSSSLDVPDTTSAESVSPLSDVSNWTFRSSEDTATSNI